MVEHGPGFNPEQEKQEPTIAQLLEASCKRWSELEDDIRDMLEGSSDIGEAIGNLFTVLLENEVDEDEIEKFLEEAGITE